MSEDNDVFSQKTVLLGVTGGIAAYKACEVLRGLQKAGVRVKVVMTRNATRFVGPATFKSLTREPVAVSLFDDPGDPVHHISLAEEADLMLICPATANVLSKLANGIADDLLTSTALALTAPLVVAPAMNVHMWENERTEKSIEQLKEQGVHVIEPDTGHLACGYDGKGKLADVQTIVEETLEELGAGERDLEGKHVLVTAGPTYEALDPVRFLGNRSSGKSGYAVAAEAARRGAQVTLVSGPTSLGCPYGVDLVRVTGALEMLEAARTAFADADAAVFTAAVADFKPAGYSPSKIKKDPDQPDRGLELTLVRNPDILKTLAAHKSEHPGRPTYVVGYAAETDDAVGYAQRKLADKGADLMVANNVSDPVLGFGTDDNKVWFVSEGRVEEQPRCSKRMIARLLMDRVAAALNE